MVEHPSDALVNDIGDGFGLVIESRHRWMDDGADVRGLGHQFQMALIKGRFANHQNQGPALLQGHVGGPDHQVVGKGMGDAGKGFYRAGCDHHAPGGARAARYRRA